MPVLILSGDEEFELTRRVQHLRTSLLDPSWASVNFLRLDNPPIADIVDAAAMLPFGPGNKVILIDRCDLFTKKKTKGSDEGGKPEPEGKAKDKDKLLDDLEKALLSVAQNTHLIFMCPFNFDSTLKTSKAVLKAVVIEKFEKEKYWPGSRHPELERWCRKEAKSFGATMEDETITYLLEGTEANKRQIANEIEKAATFILPNTHITRDVVVRLSPYHSHVFALAEYWLAGKGKEALASADELLSRQSAMPVIAALQTMISKWILLKAMCENFNHHSPSGPGLNRRELPLSELVRRVAGELKQKEFMIEKDLKRISKVSMEKLIQKRIDLTRLEDAIKTGLVPESHALQIFLAG